MIRVLVLYPNIAGKKFDFEYYKNNHIPLVKERLAPIKLEVDLGIDRIENPVPYKAVTHMVFKSLEELNSKYQAHGKELNEDKQKFTDLELVFQISSIVEI